MPIVRVNICDILWLFTLTLNRNLIEWFPFSFYFIDWFYGNFIVTNPSYHFCFHVFQLSLIFGLVSIQFIKANDMFVSYSIMLLSTWHIRKIDENERKNNRKLDLSDSECRILFHVRILFNVFNVSSTNIDKYVEN